MQKFRSMEEAAKAAEQICQMWFVREEGCTVDAEGLKTLAVALDRELADGGKNAAFLCSKEGALGLTFDFEYNAQWVFYPLPTGDALEEELLADLKKHMDALEGLSTEELKEIWNPQ